MTSPQLLQPISTGTYTDGCGAKQIVQITLNVIEMKTLLCVLLLACVTHNAIANDRPVIPPDVKYTFVDDALDATVRKSLAEKFHEGQSGVKELLLHSCICAPGYWRILSAANCVKKAVVTKFSILNRRTGVNIKLDGAEIKDKEDLERVAQHLASAIGPEPVIRRLTTNEISQFWVVIPYDIEEPVYILEVGSTHYILVLVKDKDNGVFHISWVDILTGYAWGT